MRILGIWALCAGSVMALASLLFVAVIHHSDGTLAKQVCTVGSGLCQRPSLLLIPILATLAWGLILRMGDK
jgi:hypothetical protein